MTKREIASLAIKLMGVFILIKTIAYVPMAVGSVLSATRTVDFSGFLEVVGYAIFAASVSLIPLVWALLIIVLSDKVAAWLIKEPDDTLIEAVGAVNKEDVMVVVCSCIGLYLAVAAFPNLILKASHFLAVRNAGSDRFSYLSGSLYETLQCVAPIVQIALGVWLFAGSKGIVKFWKKIRS